MIAQRVADFARWRLLPVAVWCATWIATPLVAAPISLPVTKDNSIVLVDGEWTENHGARNQIRIKANQHLVAMDFDVSAIVGRKVKRATLLCYQAEHRLAQVTLSTIAVPWDELKSNGLSAGVDGIEGWGSSGVRFPAVAGGNSFTFVTTTQSEPHEGQFHWDVPPDMIHALANGLAFGLAIHEHDNDLTRNPTIVSREQSAKKPALVVEFEEESDPAPQPPTDLALSPLSSTEARLSWIGPIEGFAYDVLVDGVPLGRHNIPFVTPGIPQVIPLRDLPATVTKSATHEVRVVTLSRTGKRSTAATVRGTIFQSLAIAPPEIKWPASVRKPIANLAVIPVADKYDQAGEPVGDLPADYRTHNSLYDGQRVRLAGAAGEVCGFQLLIRGKGQVSVDIRLPGPPLRVERHLAHYVAANGRMIPDPLVPLPDPLPLTPDADQVVFVDCYLPFDAAAGVRKGAIALSDGRSVPLELEIRPFSIPRKATFFCEMNGYGLPDHVDDYYAIQQIAYDHRVHANILHYSHHTAAPGARKSSLDMRLRSGRRMDNRRYDDISPGAREAYWDDFAEAFGPYLDGSLFAQGHRGPVPAPGFYLTFHESWPLNCRAFFNGDPDAYRAFREQPQYSETYVNILQSFGRLASDRGWNNAGFQVFLNNKGSLNEPTKAPWVLDEPASYWDYRALRYFGELTDRGRSSADGPRIDYRVDISRPEFCRGELDRRADLWVVSSSAFQHYRRLVTDRIERDGIKVWVYGTTNHVHETNRMLQGWALDAWRDGATGLVPWQTIDKSGNALKQADQLGLFIFDQNGSGKNVIRHSARLKAYREAQQLIEYLNLLKARCGWNRDQLQRFVAHYVASDAAIRKGNDDDAGTMVYAQISPRDIDSLKQAIAKLLTAKQ